MAFSQHPKSSLLIRTSVELGLRPDRMVFYYWNEAEDEIRLVTSWDTTDADIESVVVALSAN